MPQYEIIRLFFVVVLLLKKRIDLGSWLTNWTSLEHLFKFDFYSSKVAQEPSKLYTFTFVFYRNSERQCMLSALEVLLCRSAGIWICYHK